MRLTDSITHWVVFLMFLFLTALFMPLMTFINDLMAVFASNWVVNQVFAFLSYSITELIRFGNLTEA